MKTENDKFNQKVVTFAVALQDMYRDEEDRESPTISALELTEDELTEDFTAMIYAVFVLYKQITGDVMDAIGFSHLINRLIIQQAIKDQEFKV